MSDRIERCGQPAEESFDPSQDLDMLRKTIWEMHQEGISLLQIAKSVKHLPGGKALTRERVRQIVAKIERRITRPAADR